MRNQNRHIQSHNTSEVKQPGYSLYMYR